MKEIRLTLRLPAEVHKQLQEFCEKDGGSMNAEILRFIRMGLNGRLAKFNGFWELSPIERVNLLVETVAIEITKEMEVPDARPEE